MCSVLVHRGGGGALHRWAEQRDARSGATDAVMDVAVSCVPPQHARAGAVCDSSDVDDEPRPLVEWPHGSAEHVGSLRQSRSSAEAFGGRCALSREMTAAGVAVPGQPPKLSNCLLGAADSPVTNMARSLAGLNFPRTASQPMCSLPAQQGQNVAITDT